ncbi:MAG: hypothetical protein WBB27_15105 [Maribacter sp.]
MKTILKFTTVVAFMLSTVVSMAREPKVNLIADSDTKSLVLTMENTSSDVDVKIMDEEAHIIYSGKLSNGSLSRKFDLQNLKEGIYFVSTEDELKSYLYTIELDGNEMKVIKREETFKPVFRETNDRVYMNLFNPDKSEVTIKVYDAEDRVVFSETCKDSLLVEKAFNFVNAEEGSYTIVISDNEKTYYSEDFSVN